jgi:hypothetical protein
MSLLSKALAKRASSYVVRETATAGITEAAQEAANYSNQIAGERESATKSHLEEVQNRKGKVLDNPKIFSYPHTFDLGEQKHSVIFYINARSNSRVGVAASAKIDAGNVAWLSAQDALTEQYSSENRAKSENAKDVAAATTLVGVSVLAAGATTALMDGSSGFAKVATVAVAAAGATALATVATETNSTLRLLSSIRLHVAAPPQANYQAQWDNVDLGAAGKLASGTGFSLDGALSEGGSLIGYAARQAIASAAQLPKALGVDADLAGALDATQKKVANPFKEQLFKHMGFRKFGFSYKFNPRSKDELKDVLAIVQLFKYHMHPEFDDSRLYLKYPSEFNIEYHYEDSVNKYLSRVSTCALTDMKVSYGGADFNTFQNTKGAPSEINIELLFTELETLTNDRITQGPESWEDPSSWEGGY